MLKIPRILRDYQEAGSVNSLLAVWGFYGELNGLYPTAAAIRLFMKHSMDDRWALSITFTYLLTIVLVIAADAFIVGSSVKRDGVWSGTLDDARVRALSRAFMALPTRASRS